MSGAAQIPFKDILDLLNDEIFADFFNTFLNLPIFGQTPFFIPVLRQWELSPGLPSNIVNYCLLRRCIGSVRGILRFRAFLRGSVGEQLTSFWLSAERILGIYALNDSQQDLYLSLLRVLTASHLHAGSVVMKTCSISSESVLQLKCWHPPGLRREVLRKMQDEAFKKIQQYRVPEFLSHCRVNLFSFPEGRTLLEWTQQTRKTNENLCAPLPMTIKVLKNPPQIYCSKINKRRLWHLITFGEGIKKVKLASCYPQYKQSKIRGSSVDSRSWIQDAVMPTPTRIESPSINQLKFENTDCDVENPLLLPKLRATPILCPFTWPQSLVENTVLTSNWLHWALNAEESAAGPFHAYLLHGKKCARLVNLWQELRVILQVLVSNNNMELCYILSDRLRQHYLQDEKEECSDNASKTEPCLPPLIATRLRELLPFRDAIPWVLRAQIHICQSFCSQYEQFLDEEDRTFLQFVHCQFPDPIPQKAAKAKAEDVSTDMMQRIKTALELAQACPLGGEIGSLDAEAWNLLIIEGVSQGGSLKPPPQPAVIRRLGLKDATGSSLLAPQRLRQAPRSVHCPKEDPLTLRKRKVLPQKPSTGPRFKGYQNMFPECTDDALYSKMDVKERRRDVLPDKTRTPWQVLIGFIRSVCKCHCSISNSATRKDFENFLLHEIHNSSENVPVSRGDHCQRSSSPANPAQPLTKGGKEESGILHPRCRNVMRHSILVKYLINDLSFYREIIMFYRMCDAADFLATHGMYCPNDEARLQAKVKMIIKLFLACDSLPKLRVGKHRPILRYSLSKGIRLMLPEKSKKNTGPASADNLSPWKLQTVSSRLQLTSQSMKLKKIAGYSRVMDKDMLPKHGQSL
ncbi:regulator of G-protein signaling protein-like [Pelodytes ibericus]